MSLFGLFGATVQAYASPTTISSTGPAASSISALMYTSKGNVTTLIIMLVVAVLTTAIASSLIGHISSRSNDD